MQGPDTTASQAAAAAHRRRARRGRDTWLLLALYVGVAFAAGAIGTLLRGGDVGGRYLALDRPSWAPPRTAFGIVWPVLYLLIGVAGRRVWRAAGSARRGDGAQPVGGAAGGQQRLVGGVLRASAYAAAIAVIGLLDVLVVATIVAFGRHDAVAAWLLVPYLLWIAYATALNVAISAFN